MSDALEIWRLTGEIFRLRALNTELLEALELAETLSGTGLLNADEALIDAVREKRRAALAKAEASENKP